MWQLVKIWHFTRSICILKSPATLNIETYVLFCLFKQHTNSVYRTPVWEMRLTLCCPWLTVTSTVFPCCSWWGGVGNRERRMSRNIGSRDNSQQGCLVGRGIRVLSFVPLLTQVFVIVALQATLSFVVCNHSVLLLWPTLCWQSMCYFYSLASSGSFPFNISCCC